MLGSKVFPQSKTKPGSINFPNTKAVWRFRSNV